MKTLEWYHIPFTYVWTLYEWTTDANGIDHVRVVAKMKPKGVILYNLPPSSISGWISLR